MPDQNNHQNRIAQVRNRFDVLAKSYNKSFEEFECFGLDHIARVFGRHVDVNTQHGQLDILDLGCGTGLCGSLFQPYARNLDGLDLSPKMLEEARGLGIYRRLYASDAMVYFAQAQPATYDVVISAGLFMYFGELVNAFSGCARILRNNGRFVFTIDRHEDNPTDVLQSPRNSLMYTFSRAYVERSLQQAGFDIVALEAIDDRLSWQDKSPVPAFVVLAQLSGR